MRVIDTTLYFGIGCTSMAVVYAQKLSVINCLLGRSEKKEVDYGGGEQKC